MADKGKASEDVGYGKPPRATRFKQGQSGNPKGRPKGSRNFATVLQEELNTRITVTENGKRRRITKRQAVAKQLVNKGAAGDPKAILPLLTEMRLLEGGSAGTSGEIALSTPEDALVMESIVRRIREANPASDSSASIPDTTSEAAPLTPDPAERRG